jgi:hypothetical protein
VVPRKRIVAARHSEAHNLRTRLVIDVNLD